MHSTRRSRRIAAQVFSREWPEDPSYRFLVHLAMRREELCGPDLCPQDRVDATQASERELVIRRVLVLMCALNLGVRITMDEIRADELAVMLIIAEERDRREREKLSAGRH